MKVIGYNIRIVSSISEGNRIYMIRLVSSVGEEFLTTTSLHQFVLTIKAVFLSVTLPDVWDTFGGRVST